MTKAGLSGRIAATSLLAAAALAAFAVRPAQAQTLIASYSFDDPGTPTTAAAEGGIDPTTLNLYNWTSKTQPAVTPYALLGAPGSGVTGLSSDRALDVGANYSSGGGNQYAGIASGPVNGSGAPTVATYADFNPHTSAFTLVGWYDPVATSAFVSGTRLIDGSVTLAFTGGSGTLELQVGASSAGHFANATANMPVGATALNQWYFFAATWNPATSTVNFYTGNPTTAVSSLGTAVTGVTSAGTITGETIGNGTGMNRAFNGYMDDIAMYSGALSISQLEAIREQNTSSPEPTSLVLAGMGLIGAGLPLLRRRLRRDQ